MRRYDSKKKAIHLIVYGFFSGVKFKNNHRQNGSGNSENTTLSSSYSSAEIQSHLLQHFILSKSCFLPG